MKTEVNPAFGNSAPALDALCERLSALGQPDLAIVDRLAAQTAILTGITSALYETVLMGVDREGRYLFFWMPPALEERYGVRAADMDGLGLSDVFPPTESGARIAFMNQCFETGESHREEYPLELPNGTFWHDITLAPMRDSRGRVTAMVGFIRDVTERKLAESRLMESEARYRTVVEQSNDAIIIHRAGIILFHNRAVRETLGIVDPDSLNGQPVMSLIHPDSQREAGQRLARIAQGQTDFPVIEETFIGPDGRCFIGEVRSQGITYEGRPAQLAIVRDVTEQRRLRERSNQTQKLESLGLLASGVAHDFNTLLLGVLGNAGLALCDLPAGSPARARLEQIETTAIRASELTAQLLAFAGGDQPALAELDLTQLITETAALVDASLPAGAHIELSLGDRATWVMADGPQLRQVIMNLLLNAAEALGEQGGGVRVATALVPAIDSRPGGQLFAWQTETGPFVRMDVVDGGCGMDEGTRTRIFDPFFSTKTTGRGLGLAATQGIIRAHRGAIRVDSAPGQGSTFAVYLPALIDKS